MIQIDSTSYRSPNYSDRHATVIDMIVLHSGEGTEESDLDTLCSTRPPLAQRVSAHYYVNRRGLIYELVDPRYAAWHAGASSWEGRGSVTIRDASIGIETEHKAGQDWPAAQREALRQLCASLIDRYHIPQRMVAAHRWIAPDRKSDPTDWSNKDLEAWIAALYTPSSPPPSSQVDPLRARQLQGIDRLYYCGTGFAEFYQTYGGLRTFGYALSDEFKATDTLGEPCTLMRFERLVLKYKATEKPWSVRPALLSEIQKMGLI